MASPLPLELNLHLDYRKGSYGGKWVMRCRRPRRLRRDLVESGSEGGRFKNRA
jgi:hypothetical protein